MKLHLPKLLCVAVMAAMALPGMGATLTDTDIKEPEGKTSSYLEVGDRTMGTSTWEGDLVVGDSYENGELKQEGDVDYVGHFNSNWGFIEPSAQTAGSADLTVDGNVTINGNGQIYLGAQVGSKFYGLTAKKVTLNGNGSTVNLRSVRTDFDELELNNASAYLHMGYRPGNGYFMSTNQKQAIIRNNITVNGDTSYLLIGSQGGASTNNKQYHYVTSLGTRSQGLTMTQNGGTIELNGDVVAKSGLKVIQNKGKTTFRDYLSFNGAGKSYITQNGDATNKPTMVIGRLANECNGKNDVEVDIKQTGSGSIQLKYGSDFAKNGVINLIQEGSGTITVGGDGTPSTYHPWLTSFKSTNTTYNINQTGSGKINVNADAAIIANTVYVGKDAILNVNGALTIKGESSLFGTVNVGNNAKFIFEQLADVKVTTTLGLNTGNTMSFMIESLSDSNGYMQMDESGDLAFEGGTLSLNLSEVAMQEMAAEADFEVGTVYNITLIDNLSDADVEELSAIINNTLVLEDYYVELPITLATMTTDPITFKGEGLLIENNQLMAAVRVTNPGNIPEPTTATLSLLALAALASRRRRH